MVPKNRRLNRNELKFLDDWLSEWKYTQLKIDLLVKQNSNSVDEEENVKRAGKIGSYRNFMKTCNRVYNSLDKQLQEIFTLRYGKSTCLTWEEIAGRVFVSERHIYRKRERILELFAEEIGIM